jgi:HPt (histidine-containing phosphotransfer) domain-containing protein
MQVNVNFETLETMLNGDKETIRKVLNMVVSNSPKIVDSLMTNLETKNYVAIKQTIHSLKPQMVFLGLKKMLTYAEEIEKESLVVSNPENYNFKVKNFIDLYLSIIFEIKEELNTY